jgi:hypothetical protein
VSWKWSWLRADVEPLILVHLLLHPLPWKVSDTVEDTVWFQECKVRRWSSPPRRLRAIQEAEKRVPGSSWLPCHAPPISFLARMMVRRHLHARMNPAKKKVTYFVAWWYFISALNGGRPIVTIITVASCNQLIISVRDSTSVRTSSRVDIRYNLRNRW